MGITTAKTLSEIKLVVLSEKLYLRKEMESQNRTVAIKAEIRQVIQERTFFSFSFFAYWIIAMEICSPDFVVSIAAKSPDTRKRRIIRCRE